MDVGRWLQLQWDRVTAWVLAVLGVIALILGWIGVSGTGYVAKQMPYIISGGIGGILLVGLGATLWLSADLRDEWRKLDDLADRIDRLQDPQTPHRGPAVDDTAVFSAGSEDRR